MRKFTLKNELGQTYALNDVRKGFLQNPQNLGYSINATYSKIGSRWVRDTYKDAQMTITGEVVFATAEPYSALNPFLVFVRRSKQLILVYETTNGTFQRDVDLTKIGKTEITEGNVLICPVELVTKSMWYKPSASTYSVDLSSAETYRWPIEYPVMFNDFADGAITFDNQGSEPAPFKIIIEGAVLNPVIHCIQSGAEIHTCKITADVQSGSITYSSVDGNLMCVTSGGVNLVPDFSLANDNFFKLPIGQSTLKITADSALTNTILFFIYPQYRMV